MSEAWRGFCHQGTKLVELYVYRGTRFIGAANLSPVTNLVAGTGAVSRYNDDASQKVVPVALEPSEAVAGIRVQVSIVNIVKCTQLQKP